MPNLPNGTPLGPNPEPTKHKGHYGRYAGGTRPARTRTGLRALKSRVTVRGLAAIDRRTTAARTLLDFRRELLDDLAASPPSRSPTRSGGHGRTHAALPRSRGRISDVAAVVDHEARSTSRSTHPGNWSRVRPARVRRLAFGPSLSPMPLRTRCRRRQTLDRGRASRAPSGAKGGCLPAPLGKNRENELCVETTQRGRRSPPPPR